MEYLALIGLGLALGYFVFSNRNEIEAQRRRILSLESDLREKAKVVQSLSEEIADQDERIHEERMVFEQRAQLFPWLRKAFSDLEELRGKKKSGYIFTKGRRAFRSIEVVNEYKRSFRDLEAKYRYLSYRLHALEGVFPWISEHLDESLEEYLDHYIKAVETPEYAITDNTNDPIFQIIGPDEYSRLSKAERNQLALDRWKRRPKTNWQIGVQYESYVGYLYEGKGFEVDYFGAVEGVEDLGRDLIAKKGSTILIIQFKHWSKEKLIREKHIMQLFGTAVEYMVNQGLIPQQLTLFDFEKISRQVKPVFVTSTELSEKAEEFAKHLGVEVESGLHMGEYPMIKCKNSLRDKTKIYHLPFDQQYHRTKVNSASGDVYVWTVKEAEDLGFRRAYRWRGGEKN